MRIAFVAPFGLRVKGTARARALPLALAMSERGYTTALFVPPYDSPEDSGKRWNEGGVEILNVTTPVRVTGNAAISSLLLAWRLLKALHRWRPDLVHVFKPKGPSGLVGTFLHRMGRNAGSATTAIRPRGGRPVVVVDADDWEGPGGWNDDSRVNYPALQRRFFAWQERYGLSHADAWTVTSTCLRERAIHFGADPGRVFVLPNGVWARRAAGSPVRDEGRACEVEQPCAILYTRFAGVRLEDVLAIWRRVLEIMPTARLKVLGRGLAGEEALLRNIAGIDVLGWVEPGDLPELLRSARLAVVPWADTPSNQARHSAKVLELMAAGVPIVAYGVGELPATLGPAGVVVRPGDVASLAEAVVALLGDEVRARTLGELARLRVLEQFTWDRIAAIAVEAYRAAENHLVGEGQNARAEERRETH